MLSETRKQMALQSRSVNPVGTPTLDAWLKDLSQRALQATTRTTTPTIAAALQSLLGQRIVACMAGADDPKAVGRWARGERNPRIETEQRLRAAYQIHQLLSMAESPETARAWFIGMNPHLEDRAPFAVLGEEPAQGPRVLEAAKAFVVNG